MSTEEQAQHPHWRRNLVVCLAGSFTTIVAMTLLLPFLPIYVEELGVSDHAAIVQWSGIAYGATFLTAALGDSASCLMYARAAAGSCSASR